MKKTGRPQKNKNKDNKKKLDLDKLLSTDKEDYTKEEIPIIIEEMCDDLSQRLRLENKVANGVSLMIGYSKEGGFSRQLSLNKPTNESSILYDALMVIFNKHIEDLKTCVSFVCIFWVVVHLTHYSLQVSFKQTITKRNNKQTKTGKC